MSRDHSDAWLTLSDSPTFFRKLGYLTYGVSDGYPHGVTEYYLIKRL